MGYYTNTSFGTMTVTNFKKPNTDVHTVLNKWAKTEGSKTIVTACMGQPFPSCSSSCCGHESFNPFGEHLSPKLPTRSLRATDYRWPVPRCSQLGAAIHHWDIQPLRGYGATLHYLKASEGAQSRPGPLCQERSQWHHGVATAKPSIPHMPCPAWATLQCISATKWWQECLFWNRPLIGQTAGNYFLALTDPSTKPWWGGLEFNSLQATKYPLWLHTPDFHSSWQGTGRYQDPTIWSTFSAPGGKMKYLTLTLQD